MGEHKEKKQVDSVKETDRQSPVPSAWRCVFCEIVSAFVQADYRISAGIPGVAPISKRTAKQIREYVDDYGEDLVPLPSKTWRSSICVWTGKEWQVMIDLWTKSEGRSDLVLSAQVKETKVGLVVHVEMVYVP